MKDINKVILVGRLGADPIQRYTKNGTPVVHFSVATSRRIFRESSEPSVEAAPTEETQWHRVVAWGRQGEACAQYIKKGHAVYVEGYLKSRQYDDKEGKSKTSFEVQVDTISFLGAPRSLESRPLEPRSAELQPQSVEKQEIQVADLPF